MESLESNACVSARGKEERKIAPPRVRNKNQKSTVSPHSHEAGTCTYAECSSSPNPDAVLHILADSEHTCSMAFPARSSCCSNTKTALHRDSGRNTWLLRFILPEPTAIVVSTPPATETSSRYASPWPLPEFLFCCLELTASERPGLAPSAFPFDASCALCPFLAVAASKPSASTCRCGHRRHRGTWRSDLGLTAHGQLPPGDAAVLAMASLTPCHAPLSLPGPSDSPPCTAMPSTRSTACKQQPQLHPPKIPHGMACPSWGPSDFSCRPPLACWTAMGRFGVVDC